MRKGDIVRRANVWGDPTGDYLIIKSISKTDPIVTCKYISCNVVTSALKHRLTLIKKCTIKVSKSDYIRLRLPHMGVFKHPTTAQYERVEDELPDIIVFCAPDGSKLYYRVGMVYPVLYKNKNTTVIELLNLINK